MATDEKYVWGAGSPLPPIDPHSKIKHKILRDYLETYIKVLMSNVKIPKLHLSLIDGFSGGGLYQDDGIIQDYKGSPYILLESPFNAEIQLNQGRLKERKIHTNTFLVDIEPDNISHLKSALTLDGYSERFEKDIHFYSEDFCSALPKIVQRIKTIKGGERSLFLLDQYAYKDVPMKAIQHIFSSLDKAEVLLTFNIDTLITYISNKAANRKAIENIGLDTYIPWQQIPVTGSEGLTCGSASLREHSEVVVTIRPCAAFQARRGLRPGSSRLNVPPSGFSWARSDQNEETWDFLYRRAWSQGYP